MTARDAAFIANRANVKQLILTHFSQRYKNMSEMEDDAKATFDNVKLAHDCMKVNI
jgi:ribonuclease Z